MGIFRRKQRVRLDDFCAEFYDQNFLNARVGTYDVNAAYVDVVKRSVADADARFAAVDSVSLGHEMVLIRFETFALVWLHQLGDKHAASLSAFTKAFLTTRNRIDLWDNMEPYNQAIAKSSTMGHTAETRIGRGYLTFRNSVLMQSYDAWRKQGFDGKIVARAANRLCTDVACKKGMTAGALMLVLSDRLGCELNEDGKRNLVFVIHGTYLGARDALKNIKVVDSMPAIQS